MGAGFFGKVKNIIGMSEYEEEEQEEMQAEEEEATVASTEPTKRENRKTSDYSSGFPAFNTQERKVETPKYAAPPERTPASVEPKPEVRFESRVFPKTREEKETAMENRQTASFSTGNSSFKMIVIEPKSFDECPKLVDSLKARKPVIINLEKVESDTARKIFDFLSGATYALNGNMQKVSNNIFLFAPDNVDIMAQQEGGRQTESKSPWK